MATSRSRTTLPRSAAALNGNETKQSIDQSQGGSGRSGSGDATQIAGQSADSRQSADADAKAVQVKPSNSATSIRVLSPGDDGDVTQSNTAKAVGLAANGNETKQSIDQTQAGSGGSSTQVAGQAAKNHQDADADATAVQWKPSNTASSIRVLSPGKGGDVTQSNDAVAIGAALNGNETKQSIDQVQGGRAMESAKPEQRRARASTTRRARARSTSRSLARRRPTSSRPTPTRSPSRSSRRTRTRPFV